MIGELEMKSPRPLKRGLLLMFVLSTAVLSGYFRLSSDLNTRVLYKGKPLEKWFYGERDEFFQESTRTKAQEAINALGTNAFPFLLSNLKTKRGDQAGYLKLYRILPRWIQIRIPTPLSGDDVRTISLGHIMKMPNLPGPQVRLLADCVPTFANPRVRLQALNLIRMKDQLDPSYLELCHKLMNDSQPGIKLEAAIYLGEFGLTADPCEPGLFSILYSAITERKMNLDFTGYRFQQQPPGGTGVFTFPLPSSFPQPTETPDEVLRKRILTALYRLERHLSKEQQDAFRKAINQR
jgi:hypothetical protein